ncbi:MAG: right-handed parallel beta-helix repeat-containing protein [Syntrophaceae bacterium]|nr:right-handed parallel beta-helix repeat-containing protein [Candidatus Altiarchaeota archaeon]MBU4341565.1 right-handed parallel beta-helix repeat-containing protein [Candidatus Altiarchaeota archaeon]MBU4437327.1 right-handed parallel beta-helix repeat-containing protein [Candidatus Altiarchaeota archaeon]MCG2739952.1 right-handed parallel beta-helix repeat-containing protein [Syntrophaceae bacterium]MCG2783147.1 right-handed parallel beta-helix repeat-containing protein [Candidatus Altiarc
MTKKILLLLLLASTAAALPNPAAVYCTDLGYSYENSNCVFPDGSSCDGWAFFRGICGQEYSYCSLQGHSMATESVDMGSYSTESQACISESGQRIQPPTYQSAQGNSPTKAQRLQGNSPAAEQGTPGNSVATGTCSIKTSNSSLPESFDWRNISNRSYINPVKDQGQCGSCYGFSATAAAEGAYNIALNLSDENRAEFSESFLIWCLSDLPQYKYHFDGCYGSDYDYFELFALTSHGTILGEQFPYTIYDPGACSYWENPRAKFSSRHRIPCGDTEAMKAAIMTYGTIDVAVDVEDAFYYYVDGIYTDTNTSCPETPCYYTFSNHAIALVGWGNDSEYGEYWILRNSWGPFWGEDGYMRIASTAATVACSSTYLEFSPIDINSMECNDGSGWDSCSTSATIEQVRANCTSNSLGAIDSATFTLSNQTHAIFTGPGILDSGYWTQDNDDLSIPEGTELSLSVTCTESHGVQETLSSNWTATVAEQTTTTTTTIPSSTEPLCHSCSDCSAKLNGSHLVVTLTADIRNHSGSCIEFGANDVELDCQNHLIDGTGSGHGVQTFDLDSNTIRNCIITGFEDGIYLAYSSNSTLANNTPGSNIHGIQLWYSHDNYIANNTAESNTLYGISLSYSHRNAMASNDLNSNGWYSILLMESNNNSLSLNSMDSNTHEGMFLYAAFNNSIQENRACSNELLGFNIQAFSEYLEGADETPSENFGHNNTCDSTYNWNDSSTVTGCRYSCLGTTSTVPLLKGDSDGDGTVSDLELLDYIDLWTAGEVSDLDLLAAIDNWAF